MTSSTALVWFRQDLRLADNPALHEAAAKGHPIVPVYILEPDAPWALGGASRWWLHHSLRALAQSLGGLVLDVGDPREILPQLVARVGATAVYWNRCYEPHAIARDGGVMASLTAAGIEAQSFNASLLHDPWEVMTDAGSPFKVYSPFWRAMQKRQPAPPLPPPKLRLKLPRDVGLKLAALNLEPRRPNWAAGWKALWQPGEAGAASLFEAFVETGLAKYKTERDRPDKAGTSRLSPHLHFGEISPRQIWAALTHKVSANAEKFLSELAWREFSYHLLYHNPSLPEQNWRSEFDAYPWQENDAALQAWQRGRTGYPLVDAGMRELWQTGWMHNRVRMVVASFLIKHLRIDWRRGEEWFWDTLVDADLANNAASWQWVAGSGADASPYFRIFNPVVQGRKFDPDGSYIRRWCPELEHMPTAYIHAPFLAPSAVLQEARVELGSTYPEPIVDHDTARAAALAGYAHVRSTQN